jgi:formiminotetrahydrofolate cyclodeaminase
VAPAGLLGAALVQMAAGLTAGRPRYRAVDAAAHQRAAAEAIALAARAGGAAAQALLAVERACAP